MEFDEDIDAIFDTCTTTLPCEEKYVKWKIENFSAVVHQTLPNVKFTFNAGESIGLPSTWDVVLNYDPLEINKLHFRLSYRNDEQPQMFMKLDCCFKYASKAPYRMKERRSTIFQSIGIDIATILFNSVNEDDVFLLNLKLTIYGQATINEVESNQGKSNAIMQQELNRNVTEKMQNLLDSGHNSDFVIKVPSDSDRSKYESFRVHKNILATGSEVFKAMFESPMKESQSGEVTFDDLSSAGLKILLKFIYTGIVDDDWKNNPSEIADVANRFLLSLLTKFIDLNLHLICNVENAYDLFRIAKHHGLTTATNNISKYCQQIVKDL